MNKCPEKVEQAAALMRLVFEENPGVRMTRREVEACVPVEGFSVSTRQRALWTLANRRVIQFVSTDGAGPDLWWIGDQS